MGLEFCYSAPSDDVGHVHSDADWTAEVILNFELRLRPPLA
jgi:hypothetical protein